MCRKVGRTARRLGPALLLVAAWAGAMWCTGTRGRCDEAENARRPKSDEELRGWLENMIWHHGFSLEELRLATGLPEATLKQALARWNIVPGTRPKRAADAPLLVLPYPGGRHPRIGFLEGAVRPQRETKVSVFAPWSEQAAPEEHRDYVVVDVPEAIWSNLGLTYLAHTHVPTLWTKAGIELEPLEWERGGDGVLAITRKLPNGIAYSAEVRPGKEGVRMKLTLTNGTQEILSDLRVQNCVMLKGMAGMQQQTNENKLFSKPYVACKAAGGKRWVITAWQPCHRPWANEKCPCMHSDPKFPDCRPGETVVVRGWLSFYEGDKIEEEFARLAKIGWDQE